MQTKIEKEFDKKFPCLLKPLKEDEHHKYKFLFEKQEREIKNFIHQKINEEKEEISNLIVAEIGKARDSELKSVLMGLYNKIN